MTMTDINYLKEDMEFHGTLGKILLGMPQIFNAPPIFTFPEKVASEALDFRYGHLLRGGMNALRNKIMAGAKSAWNESITTTVPKSSLSWQKGGEAWKGLIGQRIYTP